jgi:SHAQKYF class myb-like DNA-binding protein
LRDCNTHPSDKLPGKPTKPRDFTNMEKRANVGGEGKPAKKLKVVVGEGVAVGEAVRPVLEGEFRDSVWKGLWKLDVGPNQPHELPQEFQFTEFSGGDGTFEGYFAFGPDNVRIQEKDIVMTFSASLSPGASVQVTGTGANQYGEWELQGSFNPLTCQLRAEKYYRAGVDAVWAALPSGKDKCTKNIACSKPIGHSGACKELQRKARVQSASGASFGESSASGRAVAKPPAFLGHSLLVTARNDGHQPKLGAIQAVNEQPLATTQQQEHQHHQLLLQQELQQQQQLQQQQLQQQLLQQQLLQQQHDTSESNEDEDWSGDEQEEYDHRHATPTGAWGAANYNNEVVLPQSPLPAGTWRTGGKTVLSGRWTKEEHDTFLEGVELHGKDWKKISAMVKTRTVVQTRTHAQKYYQKLEREQGKNGRSNSYSQPYAESPHYDHHNTAQEMQEEQSQPYAEIARHSLIVPEEAVKTLEEPLAVKTFCVQVPAGPIGICLKGGSDGEVYISSTSNTEIPIGSRLVAVDGVDYRFNEAPTYPVSPEVRVRFAAAIEAKKAQPRVLTLETLALNPKLVEDSLKQTVGIAEQHDDPMVVNVEEDEDDEEEEDEERKEERKEETPQECGPVEWCQKGLELERAQDYKGAIVLFSAALTLDPQIPVAAEAIRRCLLLAQWQESQLLVVAAAAAAAAGGTGEASAADSDD